MKKYAIKIMYDGSSYCGWQRQLNGVSVQELIEKAVLKLTSIKTSVTGSGRTDAGVHALCQVASFSLDCDFEAKKLVNGLNFYLPKDIRIFDACEASQDFCACRAVKRKTYLYKIYVSKTDNPLLCNREMRLTQADIKLMRSAAKLFEGEHDFRAFMSSGGSAKSFVRTVYKSALYEHATSVDGIKKIEFEICANGFLYNMVRKITGAIIAAGVKKKSLEQIASSLKSFVPSKEIVPAYALYLVNAEY